DGGEGATDGRSQRRGARGAAFADGHQAVVDHGAADGCGDDDGGLAIARTAHAARPRATRGTGGGHLSRRGGRKEGQRDAGAFQHGAATGKDESPAVERSDEDDQSDEELTPPGGARSLRRLGRRGGGRGGSFGDPEVVV